MNATFTPDPYLERLLQQGAKLHQHGGLARAELLYRKVLAEQPEHPHALYLLGNIALAAGRWPEAEGLLSRALLLAPGDADIAICLGNAQAMQGRHQAASVHYRYALRLQPRAIGARLNLANALRDAGLHDEAVAEYREIVREQPRHGAAQNNLANLLHSLGRQDDALRLLTAFVKRSPNDAAAHYNRGNILRERGDASGAMAAFRAAIRANPGFAEAHNNLAVLLLEGGNGDEAGKHFARALELDPAHRETLLNLAKLHVNFKHPQIAVKYLRRFVALEPDHLEARLMLALQYVAMRKFGAARDEFSMLVGALPGDAKMRVNLGNVQQELGELGPAIEQFKEALRIDESLDGAHYNLAVTLRKDDRAGEALPYLEAATLAQPESPTLANALANVYQDLGRHEEAVREYRRALALRPDFTDAEVNMSGALIAMGSFGEGWDHDDARWRQLDNIGRLAEYPQRPWEGEPLDRKKILVWVEQAPGDQVMFLSALPDLVARAGSVVLECSGRLLPLMQRSFPGLEMLPRFREQELSPRLSGSDIDYQMPMSHLQRHFRRNWEDFPAHQGYLRADPQKVAHWRERVDALGAGLKVGISWRGGTELTNRNRRSIELLKWAPLLRTPGAKFVNLQYSDITEELAALRDKEGIDLPHWPEAIEDFDETAGLLCALDLVISVPTTVIHLAGALNVPTWIMVPRRAGYRYLREGARMPWYPSVTMHRQTQDDIWDDVFDGIERALRERIAAQ